MIEIRLGEPNAEENRAYCYVVAGVEIVSDTRIEELQPFTEQSPFSLDFLPYQAPTANFATVNLVYEGVGTFASGRKLVSCWFDNCEISLEVEGLGCLTIGKENDLVRIVRCCAYTQGGLLEIVLGPALVVALAFENIFCLHASAIAKNGESCLFIGESGKGKSTLAAYPGPGWNRICDDVLPVTVTNELVQAWPHYPQLKLAPVEQYDIELTTNLPVSNVFLLNHQASLTRESKTGLRRLNKIEIATAIIRHTVAAKLFSPELLEKHLQFAAVVADTSNVFALRYPMNLKLLPKIVALIEQRTKRGMPVW